jgi:hypothetical protein
MSLHLDDEGLTGEEDLLDEAEHILNEHFPTVKRQEPPFRHIGHDYAVLDEPDGGFTTDLDHYLATVKPIVIPKGSKTRILVTAEGAELMRLNGEMSYALAGRPDGVGRVVMSQQNVSSEWCVAHLEDANAALADLQDPTRYTKLIYRPLQEQHLKLVVIADASERKKASKYGQICVHIYLMECVPPTLLGGRLHHLEHRSKKASRVSKSSLMVELLGQCKASEMGQRAVAWLREMWLGMESVKELLDMKPIIPVALVTDANDIYLSLMCDKPFSGADESACLYLESLREDLRIGRISELFWVPTDTMTCDGGTKAKTDTVMPTVMAEGSWWPREYKALR